jgi:hypothetical protein
MTFGIQIIHLGIIKNNNGYGKNQDWNNHL